MTFIYCYSSLLLIKHTSTHTLIGEEEGIDALFSSTERMIVAFTAGNNHESGWTGGRDGKEERDKKMKGYQKILLSPDGIIRQMDAT
jgi:hypothetical protein